MPLSEKIESLVKQLKQGHFWSAFENYISVAHKELTLICLFRSLCNNLCSGTSLLSLRRSLNLSSRKKDLKSAPRSRKASMNWILLFRMASNNSSLYSTFWDLQSQLWSVVGEIQINVWLIWTGKGAGTCITPIWMWSRSSLARSSLFHVIARSICRFCSLFFVSRRSLSSSSKRLFSSALAG